MLFSVDSIENTDSDGIIFILHQSVALVPQIFKNKSFKLIITAGFYARGSDVSNFELTWTGQFSIFFMLIFFMNSLLYVEYVKKFQPSGADKFFRINVQSSKSWHAHKH